MSFTQESEQWNDRQRSYTSPGTSPLYGEEEQMATSSYVGIDISKDRLDRAVRGEECVWQVDNTPEGIASLVQQMQELQPELIVVEATGGYQRAVVEALFWAGLAVAMVNPARVRQFARACGLLAKTDKLDAQAL
jgi:transposase